MRIEWETMQDKHTTVREGEDFGRVSEGNRSLARGVECRKQEDEEGNGAKVSTTISGDVEAEGRSKQSPGHLREGEQQQSATTPSVDRGHGGESEQEVHQAESPRGEQGRGVGSSSLHEDGA